MRKYKVIEDNGGGLTLAVYDECGENIVYVHTDYEYVPGQLTNDLAELKNGAEPEKEWAGNVEDPQETYNNITSYECGWNVVADNEGIYYEDMGATARLEFGLSEK